MMLALAFLAIAGGVVLMVAGVTGSSVASAAQGHPDHTNAGTLTGAGAAPPPAGSAAPASPAGGDAGEVFYSYLTKQGLTPAQAAGVIGNLKQESDVNPDEPNGYSAQWLGERLANLLRFARARGAQPNTAAVQAEFIWYELTTTERSALLALKNATTPQQAARVFSELYERPSEPMLANRERYATEALARYRGGFKG